MELVVEAFTPAHSELGITRQQLPIPADAADVVDVVALGPVEVAVPSGTPEPVTCQAVFATPSGIG